MALLKQLNEVCRSYAYTTFDKNSKQVLLNIIANAINNRSAKPVIEISCSRTDQLPQRAGGKKWRAGYELFKISDNGTGINRCEIKKLFGKFYQAGMDKQLVNSGAGLGLSIAKSIVELHGGTIWAESKGKGKGALFCFAIPALEEVKSK